MFMPEDVQIEVFEGWNDKRPDSKLNFSCYVLVNRQIRLNSLTLTLVSEGEYSRSPDRAVAVFTRSSDVVPYDWNDLYTTHTQSFANITVDAEEISATSGPDRQKLLVAERPFLVPYLVNNLSQFQSFVDIPIPRNLPDSWSYEDKNVQARVSNTAIASLKYCTIYEEMEKEVTRRIPLILKKRVRVPVDVSQQGSLTSSEKQTVSEWWRFRPRSLIQCALTVCDEPGALIHNLPVVVVINNESSRTIHKVSLALYKEYTFQTRSSQGVTVTVRQEKLTSISLPSVGSHSHMNRQTDHLNIPDNCGTSRSLECCAFVRVRFFVRLHIKWWIGSMKCDLDVHLSNE